jgi:hypothetical protein
VRDAYYFKKTKKKKFDYGNSGIFPTLCPLARTNGKIAEAARAAATACLFYLILTLLFHLLQTFNGANILPFLHMLPKAA